MSSSPRIRTAALVSTAVTTAMLLSGCGLIDQLTGETNYDDVHLNITGPADAWLDAGYANGLGDVLPISGFETEGSMICGVGEKLVAAQSTKGLGTTDVVLTSLETNTEFAHLENASCGMHSGSIDGIQYVVVNHSDTWQLTAVDLATGAMTPASEELPGSATGPAPLGGDRDGGVYLELSTGPSQLMHFVGGRLDWQTGLEPGASCILINAERIGCESTSGYTLLDTRDGSTVTSGSLPTDYTNVVWANDGFTFGGNTTSNSRVSPAYDLDGEPLDDITNAYSLSVPNPNTGALARLDDLTYLSVRAVSPKGTVLAYTDDEGLVATATGKVMDGSDYVGLVYGATAKGDAFIVDHSGSPALVDATGASLGDLGVDSSFDLDYVDGYIVEAPLDGPAKLYLPAK